MTHPAITSNEINIPVNNLILHGDLRIPINATQMVLFVHGSGSSRFSPRNRQVAEAFNQQGLATLLFDLLTIEEEKIDAETTEFRFNIPLLAERLIAVTDWLSKQSEYSNFELGYYGASTGAAAALIAAAERPDIVKAIVSRGGRPDLAGDSLTLVKAPTLLIVGGWDDMVIDLNELAKARMTGEVELKIIPEATHLFEEPGKLEEVTYYAKEWFLEILLKGDYMPYKRILIAVDGSETSKLALLEAIELAKQLKAILGITYVIDEFPLIYSSGTALVEIEPSLEEYGQQVLDDAKQVCDENKISAEILLEKISPMGNKKVSEKLVEITQSWNASLLVIGTHGRRGFNRMFLGSIAEETVRISTVPVLLIRGKEK